MIHKWAAIMTRKWTWYVIQPASKWTHWATFRRHSYLLRAAASASSQVSPILWISFLMTPLQFVLGRSGPLLNPGTSQYSACCCIRWWSIRVRWPSQRSLLSLITFSMLCCPVLTVTSSFVILSFQETPSMLLCYLWWAAFSLFDSVAVSDHNSALYKRVDGIIDSYSRILWPPYEIGQAIIFLPCGFFPSFLLSFFPSFFFSSPNLSGRRLDVDHTSIHGVALVRI